MENLLETVNDRIQYIVDVLYDGNVSKMCRELQISQSTMKDILGAKKNAPSFETIRKLLGNKDHRISADWLIFKKGDFQKSLVPKPSFEIVEKISDMKETIALQKKILAMQDEELRRLKDGVESAENKGHNNDDNKNYSLSS